MQKISNLKYISRSELDIEKYNNCLERSKECRVYARAWYLDITAAHWEALVWGDYEFVMPLPVRKKWGIRYISQPFFTQQLGIFPYPPENIRDAFSNSLLRDFPFIIYQSSFPVFPDESRVKLTRRRNRILPLNTTYESLKDRYSENTKRNLRKSAGCGVCVTNGLPYEEYLAMKRESVKVSVPEVSYFLLENLIRETGKREQGKILVARDPDGEILAGAFMLEDAGRIYYLNAFSTTKGMELAAAFALIDRYCHDHAGSGKVIDFEGSEVEGVDRFYKGFGAVEEGYWLSVFSKFPPFLLQMKNRLRP